MYSQTDDTQYIYDLLTSYYLSQQEGENIVQPYLPQIEEAKNKFFKSLSLYVGGMNETTTPEQILAATVETRQVKLTVFYYSYQTLLDTVMQRTAYIAKTRRDKETKAHLLDVIALTQDDTSIFSPFAVDSASACLGALEAFTKQVQNAFLYKASSGIEEVETKTYIKGDKILLDDLVYELTVDEEEVTDISSVDLTNWTLLPDYIYTDDKIEFVTLTPEWVNTAFLPVVDSSLFEALISYMMHKWFVIVFPEEAMYYYQEYERNYKRVISAANSTNRPLQRKYRMF